MFSFVIPVALVLGAILAVAAIPLMFRRVVRPNEVHVVQSKNKSVAYGISPQVAEGEEGEESEILNSGNAYYEWPTWLPRFGVQVIKLRLSVFDDKLEAYDAYDVDKVPFVVDIAAFFRIAFPTVAAQRIDTEGELQAQLNAILQGAVRTVLAKFPIEEIMEDRSTFGDKFTELTKDQLSEWGVVNVKNIELMDIRDPRDGTSQVVENIMAKKKSGIERDSRIEVANNQRDAKIAEIAAVQDAQVRDQQAQEVVGQRTANKDQAVGIANEKAKQEIQTAARETKYREMAVLEVHQVRQAEILKQTQIVAADQERETKVIKAEGEKQETITVAEGRLAEQQRQAEGIQAIGEAEAEAKKLSELAIVDPQITLAKEIGDNEGYQTYLVSIRNVEANETIGVEQAKALQQAGIKIIANTGEHVGAGLSSAGELFTPKGGVAVGAALEGLAQTPVGSAVLDAVGVTVEDGDADRPATNGV